MSKGWALVLILTVMVLIFWSGLQIYSIFSSGEDQDGEIAQVVPIDRVLNVEIVDYLKDNDSIVLIKNEDIQPAQ